MAECLVMAKPAGARCQLRCAYCYYLAKDSLSRTASGRMSEELLERYIAQRLEASPGPVTHFEWHGGEPTTLGVEYFETIVRLQRAHCPAGRSVTNGLQTNGLLIDDAWADFLSRERFSVGLSLDGPADLHDPFRRTADGRPTQAVAMRAFELLSRRKVFCNVLCVLHARNAAEPDRTYRFFRDAGVKYLQFLPLVVPPRGDEAAPDPAAAGASPASDAAPAPDAVGAFLCRAFDLWIRADVGRMVIQTFDEALRPLYGAPHALCVHRETCGDVAVLERDGGFYACDHFVDPHHLLGNIADRSLAKLAADPRLRAFGLAKRESLPAACRGCDVLAMCNGGCPKDRFEPAPDGGTGLNHLCAAYARFFRHCRPELTRLAEHMKAGRPLRAFRALTA